MGTLHQIFPKLFSCCSIAISSIVLYTTKLSFFIHHPKMMLGSSSNSAERRQKCTTTIRSRRAHPRRVLDTAALNAHVPDDVGSISKSHNQLTWNHVVSVVTFFGLLMTVLVSLCCWSHFQYTTESRRLAAEEIESVTIPQSIYRSELPCYRRRLVPDKDYEQLPYEIRVTAGKELNGIYNLTSKTLPTWYTSASPLPKTFPKGFNINGPLGRIKQFAGSERFDDPTTFNLESWKKHAGRKWYICTTDSNRAIFFDVIQKKWHICDEKELYYRGNNQDKQMLPFPEIQPMEHCTKCGKTVTPDQADADQCPNPECDNKGDWKKGTPQWYSDKGWGKCKCNTCGKKQHPVTSNCDGIFSTAKTVFACGQDESNLTIAVKSAYEELPQKINVKHPDGKLIINGKYTLTGSDLPEWFEENAKMVTIQFGGSNAFDTPTLGNLAEWKKHAGDQWYLKDGDHNVAIFFDLVQKKWHICGSDVLYYRGNNAGPMLPLLEPVKSWYADTGESKKWKCTV